MSRIVAFILAWRRFRGIYISIFGILILALRQGTLSQEWLESEAGKRLTSVVNAVWLESEQSQADSEWRSFEDELQRMERHIMLQQHKISDQKVLLKIFKASASLVASSTSCPSPPADSKSFLSALIQTPCCASRTQYCPIVYGCKFSPLWIISSWDALGNVFRYVSHIFI